MLCRVPMMNGPDCLKGLCPISTTTTIFQPPSRWPRRIMGKVHCESFLHAGRHHTNSTGRCITPTRWDFPPAGSSSGSSFLFSLVLWCPVFYRLGDRVVRSGCQHPCQRILLRHEADLGSCALHVIMPIEIFRRSHTPSL